MGKGICSAVHHGLCITAYGAVNPCCATTQDFSNLENTSNLVDYFYNDVELEKARKIEIETEEWLEACKGCEIKSKSGLVSRKDKFSNWYRFVNPKWTAENKHEILHMDISFGNSCNQKCIMCNSNFSSQWLDDDLEMKETAPYIRNWNGLKLKNWSLTYEYLDQIALLVTDKTQKIEIKGGEPLYDKRFEYFVLKVLEVNENVMFNVNTNGTHFSMKNIEMLNKIKNINIDISFDGINKIYEWIRGTEWKKSEENFQTYLQHCKHSCNLNYTTSMYNIDHFEIFYNWAADLSEKYKKAVPCLFTQVVMTPSFQQIMYADKKRIHQGLEQIERIKHDPRGTQSSTNLFRPRLEIIQKYLENQLSKTADINIFEKAHNHFVKIRGWDIRDYVNL